MSETERSGSRDLLYNGWHRTASIARYLPRRAAYELGMIDVDCCEYCRYCRQPLALVETQRSAAPPKAAAVTVRLAEMAGIPAFSVSYSPNDDGTDIVRFRWRELWPRPSDVRDLTPEEYADWLLSLRVVHAHFCDRRSAA